MNIGRRRERRIEIEGRAGSYGPVDGGVWAQAWNLGIERVVLRERARVARDGSECGMP